MLSDDYFAVPEDAIADITSVLTILGGKPVHGDGDFAALAPPLPSAMPDWSPVRRFGGYQQRSERGAPRHAFTAASCNCAGACTVHGHAHAAAWTASVPATDPGAFWGASAVPAGRSEEPRRILTRHVKSVHSRN